MPEQDVVNMNRRLCAPDHSLNAPLRADSEGEWQDWLVDEQETQEIALAEREELGKRRALLKSAMTKLNERERHILTERRLKDEPTTLEDLSQHYGISRERVRQIEVRFFDKLQKAIRSAAVEQRLAWSESEVRRERSRGPGGAPSLFVVPHGGLEPAVPHPGPLLETRRRMHAARERSPLAKSG